MKDRVRMLREELGISQEELGRRSGLTKAAISQIELGKVNSIKSDKLVAMAHTLKVDVEWLAVGTHEGRAIDATQAKTLVEGLPNGQYNMAPAAPIMGEIVSGPDGDKRRIEYHEPEVTKSFPGWHRGTMYRLRVATDEFYPFATRGDILFFGRSRIPHPGDKIMIYLKGGGIRLGTFLYSNTGTLYYLKRFLQDRVRDPIAIGTIDRIHVLTGLECSREYAGLEGFGGKEIFS